MKCWIYTLFLVLINVFLNRDNVLAKEQYSRPQLPALYKFDEYDECFQGNRTEELASTYCMVYAEIKPDNLSKLWQNIKTHIEINSFNYRYDRLYFGLCLKRCLEYTNSAELNEDDLYTTDDVVNNKISKYFSQIHNRPFDVKMRNSSSKLMHFCINKDFENKYKLKLRTFVKYCVTDQEGAYLKEDAKNDPFELLFERIVEIIIFLVVFSTFYDHNMKSKQRDDRRTNDFYKRKLTESVPRLLTAFSIFRNYYRLTQPYHTKLGRDFAYLDGFRVFTTMSVIFFHVIYSNANHIENPGSMEYFENTKLGNIILNTPVAIEIFMVISGMFACIKFKQLGYVTPKTTVIKCLGVVLLSVLQRFFRYLPSVGLFVLFYATTLRRLVNGPFYRHIYDSNYIFTRENWWKNIYLINNFSVLDTIGPHTWYIAADFQLFFLYTIVMIVTEKYPKYRNRIYKSLAVLAVVIPTFISYYMKLGSSFIPSNESFRTGNFLESKEYRYQYTPFYNNLGGYLFGIICGDVYLNTSNKAMKKKMEQYATKAAFLMIFSAAAILYMGSIMMFQEPSLLTAIYSGLHRNLWIVFVCGIPIILMMFKIGGIFYEFCTLRLFRVLARLSFQMHLWHLMILFTYLANIRQPFHMNLMFYLSLCLITYTAAAIISLFITLFVEYPFAQLLEISQTIGRNISGFKLETYIHRLSKMLSAFRTDDF